VQIVQVLAALIVLFVAAPPLVRAIYRLRPSRTRGISATMSKGWNA
jgi:general nucleoside transport system permease protein